MMVSDPSARRTAWTGLDALRLLIVLSMIVATMITWSSTSLPRADAQSPIMVSIPVGSANATTGAPGFAPDRITVVIGVNNTITWTNDDTRNHTVTSLVIPTGATPFDSKNFRPGTTYTVTLTTPGLYRYGCTYHAWMAGSIDVVAANGSASSSSSSVMTSQTPGASSFPTVYLLVAVLVVVAVALVAVTRLRSRPGQSGSAAPAAAPANAMYDRLFLR